MPNITSEAVQVELHKLRDQLQAIRLGFIIDDTESRGIRLLIDEYVDKALYLAHLNDLPMLLAHYGQAVGHLNVIERHQPMPEPELENWPWLMNQPELFIKLQNLLSVSYDRGEDLCVLYRRLWWFHVLNHVGPQTLVLVLKSCWSSRERLDLKALVLLLYSKLFQSDWFNDRLRQPLKDRCLKLLDEMELLVGRCGVARPDTKRLTNTTATELFVRVPRDFNDLKLPDNLRQIVEDIKEKADQLRRTLQELRAAEAQKDPDDE